MIHLLHQPASPQQVREMLEEHEDFIKIAVDIRRGILAGGGEFHADCEAVLIEDGSEKDDIWGADWILDEKTIRYSSLINLRRRQDKKAMDVKDPSTRQLIEQVTKRFFQGHG